MAGAPNKSLLIKKAIREIAERDGHPKDLTRVDSRVIFNYMKENKIGVWWISKNLIKSIRDRLPEHYRENIEK